MHRFPFHRRRPTTGPIRSRKARLEVEVLEDRTLLSAAQFVPNEVLVQFQPGASAAARAAARGAAKGALAEIIQTPAMVAAGQGVLERVTLPATVSVQAAIKRFKNNPNVKYAEPNWIYSHQATSDDPYYTNGSLWGMYGDATSPANAFGSQAGEAWAANNTGSNTVYIGIIDEGIDYNHEDLAGRIATQYSYNFVKNTSNVYDGNGKNNTDAHGTHVAGTIGAIGNNGIGVAGVDWNVQIISAKFLATNGGTLANAIRAVNHFTALKTVGPDGIAGNGDEVNIIATNNSWGGGGFSQLLLNAINTGYDAGILFIAAAGNSSANNDTSAFYPANYNSPAVVSVAAITSSGGLASFSNYGATTVDIGAPGAGIVSTITGNRYASYNGTSMATPHVTGAAALYAAANPGKTAAQIKAAILNSAAPTASLAGKTATGGRLDIGALMGASTPPPALPTISIDNVSKLEDNTGLTEFTFTVTLSSASNNPVTVAYTTANGSATAGSDYATKSGTLTFTGSQTTQQITVSVNADTDFEPDETFFVVLSSPTNATIAVSQGQGTIQNDDPKPPTSSNDMYVAEIGWATVPRGKFFTDLNITITIRQDANADGTANSGDDDLVSGAAVTFQLSGAGSGTATATTGSAGTVVFKVMNVSAGLSFMGTVIGLTHPTFTWNETTIIGQKSSDTYTVGSSQSLTATDVIAPAAASLNPAPVVVSASTSAATSSSASSVPAKGKGASETSGPPLTTGKPAFDAFWAGASLDDAELLQAI